jgi:hypothetical protein
MAESIELQTISELGLKSSLTPNFHPNKKILMIFHARMLSP